MLLLPVLLLLAPWPTEASKAGVFVERSPESTIAPLHDEVMFECELNLVPERLEWRFRPSVVLTQRHTEYIYLNKSVSTFYNCLALRSLWVTLFYSI